MLSICKYYASADFAGSFMTALDDTLLTEAQKYVIEQRYVRIVQYLSIKATFMHFLYIALTFMITIMGALITAFASFDHFNNNTSTSNNALAGGFLWAIWGMGIALIVSNKCLYVFDIPKKHVIYTIALEKAESEGWSFVAGIGMYALDDIEDTYKLFCERVEKLEIKLLESMPELESTGDDLLAMGTRVPLGESRGITPRTVAKNIATGKTASKRSIFSLSKSTPVQTHTHTQTVLSTATTTTTTNTTTPSTTTPSTTTTTTSTIKSTQI